MKQKVEPWEGSECSRKMRPLKASMIFLQMERPRPMPEVLIAAVFSNLPNKENNLL